MARRILEIAGTEWEVSSTGRVTQYTRDEFGVLFTRRDTRERRVTRYSPLGSRRPGASLAELSTQQLRDLWERSQPAWTAPETEYQR